MPVSAHALIAFVAIYGIRTCCDVTFETLNSICNSFNLLVSHFGISVNSLF